ncbi:MAG: Gfo/Idh/MocA family oxidoreductase [Lentisphaerae bacterium]|nr:Gfo/Idh/MocA family oxidoreductase [Lentisphaerota bacterium]
MARMHRRTFLKSALGTMGATSFPISGTKASRKVIGANDRINVGVAGINNQGSNHVRMLAGRSDVAVTHLIDPDRRTWAKNLKILEEKAGKPTCVQDIRKALEDKNLDAVYIATCHHWHCLITIWACQAGKDVFVEKPLSQNVHEGRIAIETARKHKRVIQYGTWEGSLGDSIAALAKAGTYGKLLVSRGLCYKGRASIGHKEPKDPPPELDFDIWTGPAPRQPYHENLVHYQWHWFWDFGNGDIGNQGSHQMHAVPHALGDVTLPRAVLSVGGRFGYTDQGQTANTQMAVFDYGDSQAIFEVRGLKTDKYLGQAVGNTFHFEAGVVAGGQFYPKGGGAPQPAAQAKAERVSGADFFRCLRTRETDVLQWNIETAHYSSALCHLANISYRLGREVPFGSNAKPFASNAVANETFERMQDHLNGNGLNLVQTTYRLGRALKFDPAKEKFIDDPEADALLTRPPRPPFDVPEKA